MSTEQQAMVDANLRHAAFPVASDVDEQRRLLREAVSAQPLADGIYRPWMHPWSDRRQEE